MTVISQVHQLPLCVCVEPAALLEKKMLEPAGWKGRPSMIVTGRLPKWHVCQSGISLFEGRVRASTLPWSAPWVLLFHIFLLLHCWVIVRAEFFITNSGKVSAARFFHETPRRSSHRKLGKNVKKIFFKNKNDEKNTFWVDLSTHVKVRVFF